MTELQLREAVPLAHAVVARVAADHDVRVLFFKGPVAARQGLRPERDSQDVDALVDPARLEVLAGALTALGWVDEQVFGTPTAATYSRTHRHAAWPCELDLHTTFPGLYAPAQEVFERLWARRESVELATHEVASPDPQAHALLLALNTLRDPHETTKIAQLNDLVRRVSGSFDARAVQGLGRLAGELGAPDTAAPFLSAVGAPNDALGSTAPADLHAWRLRTQPAWRVATWMDGLREQPLRRRPGYLWYAAMLTDDELRRAHPELPPGRLPLLRLRLGRLRRGLSAVPAAWHNLRDANTEPSPGAPRSGDHGGEPRETVVVTLLRPEGDSGVQTHVSTLVQQLRQSGRPVTLITPFSARSPLVRPVFALRIPLRRASRPAGVWWYRRWHARYLEQALRRHLAQSGRGGAVIYAQCPVSADVALRARARQPVVMIEHFNVSQAEEWAEKGEVPRSGRVFGSILAFEERVLPRLDGIVYVSDFARAGLQERIPALAGVPSVVIPNFVRPSDVPARPSPTRDLVTVGTLEPRKNQGYQLEILAAAAEQGHRFTLTVVGGGPDRGRLEGLVRSLGLDGQVRLVGQQHDVRAFLRDHRLYCHTATIENLPIAPMEAMAEGLPVLAAPVGGILELFTPGVEGEVWELGDPVAAARVLVRMLSDDAKLATMAQQARDRVDREFTAAAVVPRLEDFLQHAGVLISSSTSR
ncbi:glycosyltransferase [Nocardioides cynanchi]|uniref:glycosyltransferase n=1 Tax=Nocardioides cynanchi TaxID=2558918 RepID=UPI001243AB0E|nr:glycosyltransferase [Nocardioides cynanchi]